MKNVLAAWLFLFTVAEVACCDQRGTRESPVVLRGHDGWIAGVAFSPDGKRIATAGDDGALIVWNVASGKPITKLTDHQGGVSSVAFSLDGERIATGGWDSTVKLAVYIWMLE